MDKDEKQWIEDSITMCQKAQAAGAHIVLRNEDDGILITNAKDADTIRALGEAWAGPGESS